MLVLTLKFPKKAATETAEYCSPKNVMLSGRRGVKSQKSISIKIWN